MDTKSFNTNIVGSVCTLLDHFAIRYEVRFIDDFLKQHKDYPSLSSISALLDEFKIENIPIKIAVNQLTEIPLPAIAYLDLEKDKKFVLLTTPPVDGIVHYTDPKLGQVRSSIEEFASKWSGVLLVTEANGESRSEENDELVTRAKAVRINHAISITLMILCLLSTAVLPTFSGVLIPLVVLKLIGAATSVLLLAKDMGFNTKLSDSICSLGGKSEAIGCDKVSNSKAATILGVLKMSEAGAAYFLGGLIYLIMSIDSATVESALPSLQALTLLSIPYTIFSVYYQIKVVKQLCPLCMIVIVVLWAELIAMVSADISLLPSRVNFASFLTAFSVPAILWLLVRDNFARGMNSEFLRNKMKYFTSSAGALKAILQERKVDLYGEAINKITINPDRPMTVTAVLSLFCGPCAHAFNEIRSLSSRYEHITFDIILFPGDSASEKITRFVLERKLLYGDAAAIEYLTHWYDHTLNKLPDLDEAPRPADVEYKANQITSNWANWLRANNISHTPSIYVNNALKPTGISLNEFEPLFRSMEKLQLEPVF